MADRWWSDDDQLLSLLKAAREAGRDVPPEIVDAGKAAFAWRNIDAELAALTYDSYLTDAGSVTRAEPAPLRALTFATAQITIELEVTADTLVGQIVPEEAGSVTARLDTGQTADADIDEMGYFVFRPIPPGRFRLRCRTQSGADVLTGWITP